MGRQAVPTRYELHTTVEARPVLRSPTLDHYGKYAATAEQQTCGSRYRFIRSTNNSKTISAILTLAKADHRVCVDHDELDARPLLLNLKNGTLDFETGELHPHRRDNLLTQVSAVSFDKDATCPGWDETMRVVFDEDVDLIQYVTQVLGYAFTGDTGQHVLPIFFGTGFNGKSTIWNTLLELAGDYGAGG